VKRPSFLTGIPSRAHRCAVAGGKLKKAPMAAQPFSVPLSFFGFEAVFFFALTGTSLCLAHAVLCPLSVIGVAGLYLCISANLLFSPITRF
jgi:hypothetical protein